MEVTNDSPQKRESRVKRSRDVRTIRDGVLFIQHVPKQGGQGRGEINLHYDSEEWGDFIISSIPPERIRILPADSN